MGDTAKANEAYSEAKKLEAQINEAMKDIPFARVFPKFGGPPSEKILPAWKAPETEWAQDVLKDAYIEAAAKVIKSKKGGVSNVIKDYDKYIDDASAFFGGEDLSHRKGNIEKSIRQFLDNNSNEFNKELSQVLQKKGYKALLYSPGRYNEYELRMLNPDDVIMLDMRTQGDKALGRMAETERHTYPKGELVIKPPGTQKKRLGKWREQTYGAPSSLGDIYKDIDFSDILKKAH